MICKKYDSLSHFEKVIYVGELLHACQSNDELYALGKDIIELARLKGLMNGVKILPDNKNDDSCQEKQT